MDMAPTLEQVQNWFNEYNALIFHNMLPCVQFTFTNNRRQLGQFWWKDYGRQKGIKISLYWERNEEHYRNTLLHEMCHLYCYYQGWQQENHGKRWKEIAEYAGKLTGMEITCSTNIEGLVPRS